MKILFNNIFCISYDFKKTHAYKTYVYIIIVLKENMKRLLYVFTTEFVMKTISYWDDLMTAPMPLTMEYLLIYVYTAVTSF